MMRLFFNKKAGEKLLSAWWIFVLFLIAGGILIGVLTFYLAEINTNTVESSILLNKITECIVINGNLNSKILGDDFDIYKECRLDAKVFGKGSSFYFNISVYDENGLVKEVLGGANSFEADCRIGEKIFSKNFPKCSRKDLNGLINGDKALNIKILIGSNQKGGKIPVV